MDEVNNYSLKDSGYVTWLCGCCNKPIEKEEELWVKEEKEHMVYHFSCYNYKKAKENEQE